MTGKLTTPRLLCISLASLTGCATTAELEDLRAEVARANAVATRAAADLARTQRELDALKAEQTAGVSPPDSPALGKPPLASSTRPHGYKWGPPDP